MIKPNYLENKMLLAASNSPVQVALVKFFESVQKRGNEVISFRLLFFFSKLMQGNAKQTCNGAKFFLLQKNIYFHVFHLR